MIIAVTCHENTIKQLVGSHREMVRGRDLIQGRL